jgi:nucleoside-diphosphate-sugar epimerase
MTTPIHPRVLVTGAGGFIGHHLVTALKQRGCWVRGVDITATRGIDHVYALAADMGGMGFISANHATILRNKRIVRFHNIYGPYGTYDGGREKVPAALCRKVAAVEPGGEIQVWGDGEQTRSFCYVDDCVEGIYRLMVSDSREPLNLGSEAMVTVNELARIIVEVSGKDGITLRHVDGPQGVRGRSSDNRRLREVLRWEPSVTLRQGLEPTYRWIEKQVTSRRPPWAAAGR